MCITYPIKADYCVLWAHFEIIACKRTYLSQLHLAEGPESEKVPWLPRPQIFLVLLHHTYSPSPPKSAFPRELFKGCICPFSFAHGCMKVVQHGEEETPCGQRGGRGDGVGLSCLCHWRWEISYSTFSSVGQHFSMDGEGAGPDHSSGCWVAYKDTNPPWQLPLLTPFGHSLLSRYQNSSMIPKKSNFPSHHGLQTPETVPFPFPILNSLCKQGTHNPFLAISPCLRVTIKN